MTKKSNSPNQIPQGGLKKGKIKRKQMFNQLQTLHEERINQNQQQQDGQAGEPALVNIEEESDQKIQKIQIGKQKSIEEVCEAVNQLMAKNKIGAKNAFDVPIVDLFELINFNKTNLDESQNTWKTLSSTFQNDSKIYAYRVDAIHSIAYSILNIMSRRSTETEQKLKPELQKSMHQDINSTQFTDLKDSFLSSVDSEKTFLQKDSTKINISTIQCNMTSDPTLQRTKRLFDEPGLKGMLTNSIQINKNLELSLFSHVNHQPYSMKLTQMNEVDTKTIQHPLKVFESIQKIKSDVNKILGGGESKILTNKELEQIWGNVKRGLFNDWSDGGQKVWLDVEDPQCRQNFDMMIDENSQNHALFDNTHRKFIGDFIKLKNPPKKAMSDQQMALDGQRWLNEMDKKFLGIKSSNVAKIQAPLPKQPPRAYDDVNFADLEIYQLDDILRKQSPTKEINEDIEDRFLTTIRPSNEFKIQKILTLREEPQVELHQIEQQMAMQHDHEHFLEKQIDVKRQMTSIKEIKDTIFNELETQAHTSFLDVYQGYCKRDEDISPALCFLTLLHLANEKNLAFETTQNETDFFIRLPQK